MDGQASGKQRVEVVYALPERQIMREVDAAEALTALQAVRLSGILDERPELVPETLALGVFGRPVTHDHKVRGGDRVEIYRPLQMDPREARRQLAQRGEVMGRSGRPGMPPREDA